MRRGREFPELLFIGVWSGGTWLEYALFSTNYSGTSCTIRWFVPLLAGGYYVLAVFLRAYPCFQLDLAVLSAWGCVAAVVMWCNGPWHFVVPRLWLIQIAALLSWSGCWAYRLTRPRAVGVD